MFKLEVIAEDELPEGCTYALVETVEGDVYGFVKQSRLNSDGLPEPLKRARRSMAAFGLAPVTAAGVELVGRMAG